MQHITNRYEIIEKLGQGGMGAVYKAYDRLEKTEVALKQVLIPENQLAFGSKAGTDDTNKLRLSLAQEFSILATLRHPHILSVLDFGFDKGHPFYTMTLLEGGMDFKSYAEDLTHNGKIRFLTQMLQALHYLHRRGILHRDLKPDNVFVTRDEQVKVMDFGLAKKAKQDDEQTEQDDSISGTIMYMSPELFQGGKASVSSDLYALGLMAYEILTGKYPFELQNIGTLIMKIMTETPNVDAVPNDFAMWIERLLDRDPNQRYSSAYDALQGLYSARNLPVPPENQPIRESFLQASEFIGRDAELKQLTTALNTLNENSAFFLIGGESGVGKSRLLDELRIQALVKGATVLRGQEVEGGGLPFQLWRNIVRRMLLLVDVTDLQASVLKDIVPDVSELLGREIANAPELTGKAYRERIILNIVDLFRKLTRPVVLLLEDLQWADESLAVLEQMLKVPEQLPKLMIVATYRDDDAPDLPAKLTGMTRIKLERLTPDAVSELSSAILGDVGTNEEVVKLLHSQSEGNLFFLVETVRALAEASGDLQRIGQGELPEGVFTGGMQAITRRRLSKVDAQYSDVQMLAAVIGREIDTKLLEHAYVEATVQAWLSNAAEYNVVNVQDNKWRFAHDKLRETLIADVPDDTLPKLHHTAAEAIEAVYPDDDGYNESLLTHWRAAGDFDKELFYLDPLAKQMIRTQGAHDAAQRLLQQTLARMGSSDDARQVPLLNWLALSKRLQGHYDPSRHYAEAAQQLATKQDLQAGLAISLGHLASIAIEQGAYAKAADLFQQSLAIYQQLGDQHGIAGRLNDVGQTLDFQGEYGRASDLYQQSLALHEQLGEQRGIAGSLNNLAIIACSQGEYSRGADLFEQSLAICRQLGDQGGIAQSLGNLGIIAQHQEAYDRANDLQQQSLAICRQLGEQRGIAMTLNNLGSIAKSQGEYARATDLFQQSLAIYQQLGNKHGLCNAFMGLGWVAFKQGDVGAAGWFVQTLRTAHGIQATPEILWSVVGFAGVLLQGGQPTRAARLAGLVQHHPTQNHEVLDYLAEVIPQLEAALSPEDLQAALERGKTLDLDTVVQELLDEFAPDDL